MHLWQFKFSGGPKAKAPLIWERGCVPRLRSKAKGGRAGAFNNRSLTILAALVATCIATFSVASQAQPTESETRDALERATRFLRSISTGGGYAGIYSVDLTERYGEALYEKAAADEIWVQPPGTPTVGEVFLRAFRVTGEALYLSAARDVGLALAWGQSEAGGWDHRVKVAHRQPGRIPVRRKGHGTFDDNITQGAISFLMELDREMTAPWLSESIETGLDFMREAQFDNGAWPQWYPLRGGYHDYYTFNDNAINDCIRVMLQAHEQYDNEAYLESARAGGDFILLSQQPEPQAGWAQQHSHDLKPAWARSFEPPGICSAATSRNIRTLVDLYLYTGDDKYLGPIPKALDWLDRSQIRPGVWARLYEVGTNRPIYGDRESDRKIFHDYDQVSERERSSYGWQGGFGVESARQYYRQVRSQGRDEYLTEQEQRAQKQPVSRPSDALVAQVERVLDTQDSQGRWIEGDQIRIATFVDNMRALCRYLESVSTD